MKSDEIKNHHFKSKILKGCTKVPVHKALDEGVETILIHVSYVYDEAR